MSAWLEIVPPLQRERAEHYTERMGEAFEAFCATRAVDGARDLAGHLINAAGELCDLLDEVLEEHGPC